MTPGPADLCENCLYIYIYIYIYMHEPEDSEIGSSSSLRQPPTRVTACLRRGRSVHEDPGFGGSDSELNLSCKGWNPEM